MANLFEQIDAGENGLGSHNLEHSFSLILINAPLTNMTGTRLATKFSLDAAAVTDMQAIKTKHDSLSAANQGQYREIVRAVIDLYRGGELTEAQARSELGI